jgi:hypothetical protein
MNIDMVEIGQGATILGRGIDNIPEIKWLSLILILGLEAIMGLDLVLLVT